MKTLRLKINNYFLAVASWQYRKKKHISFKTLFEFLWITALCVCSFSFSDALSLKSTFVYYYESWFETIDLYMEYLPTNCTTNIYGLKHCTTEHKKGSVRKSSSTRSARTTNSISVRFIESNQFNDLKFFRKCITFSSKLVRQLVLTPLWWELCQW